MEGSLYERKSVTDRILHRKEGDERSAARWGSGDTKDTPKHSDKTQSLITETWIY